MIIQQSFEVDAPVERVWELLKDVPRVATCMPNAELTEVVDERTYRAKVSVKVGPVSVSYRATLVVESFDDAAHVATFRIKGDEMRGRGGVNATMVSTASARDSGTHVDVRSDAQISGIVATVGGRLIEGVAHKTIAQFAQNLARII